MKKLKSAIALVLCIICAFTLSSCSVIEKISNKINPDKELTGEQIYEKAKNAVVEIITYKKSGEALAQGSGFFVSEKEICTNYHVIEGAYSIEVKLLNGTNTSDLVIIGYDKDKDLASLKLNSTKSKDYLECDTSTHNIGETIYTLGSSKGLTSTFSDGVISANDRNIENVNCYQISAPISAGNSGGPLLSKQCKVLGINSMSLTTGQNLNFSIKISEYKNLPKDKNMSPSDFASDTNEYFDINVGDIQRYEIESSSFSDAQTLPRGATIMGEIANQRDLDFYKVYLEKGSLLTVSLAVEMELDLDWTYVILCDGPSIDNIVEAAVRTDDTLTMIYQVNKTGYHYIAMYRDTEYPYPSTNTEYAAFVFWNLV